MKDHRIGRIQSYYDLMIFYPFNDSLKKNKKSVKNDKKTAHLLSFLLLLKVQMSQ